MRRVLPLAAVLVAMLAVAPPAGAQTATTATQATTAVSAPPAPEREPLRARSGAAPTVEAGSGDDAPAWVLPAVLAALAAMAVVVLSRLTGAASRVAVPLGGAFTEAGANVSEALARARDRVRFGS